MQNLQSLLRKLGQRVACVCMSCMTTYRSRVIVCAVTVFACLIANPFSAEWFLGITAVASEGYSEEMDAQDASDEELPVEAEEETQEVKQADSKENRFAGMVLAQQLESKITEDKKVEQRIEDNIHLFAEEVIDIPDDVTADRVPMTVEELFLSRIDVSSIPAELSVSYQKGFLMELSKEERVVLERIVEAEAGGEDIYGRMLVANVVLNRVLSEEFPDTVEGVVFQNNGKTYQFSPVRKGGRYYTITVSEVTKRAVDRVLAGEDYSDGAKYFFARRLTSSQKAKWFDSALSKVLEYGCHEFFKDK